MLFENYINDPTEISIVDIFGKEVYHYSKPISNSQDNVTLNDLEILSKGVYILRISSYSKIQNIKFVKESAHLDLYKATNFSANMIEN